jgi:hypothetical protein
MNKLYYRKIFNIISFDNKISIFRSVNLLASYIFNAIILVACIALVKNYCPPHVLNAFLVYFFIASTAAGLEPGTSKALLAIGGHQASETGLPLLLSSALKALLLVPPLVVVWVFSDQGIVNISVLAWAPVIVILGFVATDLRVSLDDSGRHTLAIWCKQGSLALAAGIAAAALVLEYSLATGIAVSCSARAAWIAAFWLITKGSQPSKTSLKEHLFKRPWGHLLIASCLGAVSGSVDRIVAFRFLDPGSISFYVMTYEIMTKFWVINYLLAPLVFNATIRNGTKNIVSTTSYIVIGCLGVLFVIGSSIVSFLDIVEWPAGATLVWALPAFSFALVITAFSGILATELQALNQARATSRSAAAGFVVSAVAFPLFLLLWGIEGIFCAWVAKSSVELSFLVSAKRELR